MRTLNRWLVVAFFAACGAVAAQAAPIAVYRGATLIDGPDAPKPSMAIIIDGERIRAVVPDAEASSLAMGATIVDAHGLYVLPGLIDSHVHLATAPERRRAEAFLRRFVYSGVTAVRDMAGDARLLADMSRDAQLGAIAAPDISFAALMAGPAFFKDPRTVDSTRGAVPGQVPWMRAITGETDLKIAVAEAHGTGATAIKIYADLPGTLVKGITEEAHRQHMLVWAHAAVFPATPREVIDAGVDVVSHSCLLAYQASHPVPPAYHGRPPVDAGKFTGDNPELDALFADMKSRGTILDATLYVYEAMWRAPNPQPPPYCRLALAEKIAAEAHRAGVLVSTGTDAPGSPRDPYPSLFTELSLLVHHAGFTPAAAIDAATRVGAMTIGRSADMGSVAPGKLADLVFVAKNPLADIDSLKSVVMTVKHGHLYRRAEFKPITKDEAADEF
jgi:imidazolonepropionase-like amidohydrolase